MFVLIIKVDAIQTEFFWFRFFEDLIKILSFQLKPFKLVICATEEVQSFQNYWLVQNKDKDLKIE